MFLQLEREVDGILRMEVENLKQQLLGEDGDGGKKGKGKGKKGKGKKDKGKKGEFVFVFSGRAPRYVSNTTHVNQARTRKRRKKVEPLTLCFSE